MPGKGSIGLVRRSSSEENPNRASHALFVKVKEQFLGSLLEDRYLVENIIGKGSSSIVFAASDIKSLRKVAIKVLIDDMDSAGRRIDRFNQETRTTRYLRHNNILESYSYGTRKNHAYFVMEYLNGGSLEDLLNERERLSEIESIEIVRQVASALAYAHREGVIHRDVKPSNILFTDESHDLVKLVDFGMSTRLSWDYSDDVFRTPAGEIYGTTLYMSPEQTKGENSDQRTDIYSLGCVFYECLTGMPPHTGKTAIDIIVKHQNESIVPVNQALMSDVISIQVQTMVDKMLRKNVKDRYKNLEMILRDFDDLERGEFNHELYLTPAKKELECRRVKDYSNLVFLGASIIVAAVFGLGLFLLDVTSNRLVDNSSASGRLNTVFDTAADADINDIGFVTTRMLELLTIPAYREAEVAAYYTQRWKTGSYKLLKETWNEGSITFNRIDSIGNIPSGALQLESIDKPKGTASVLVDTSPWLATGPSSLRLKFRKVSEKWLIDDIQPSKANE